MNACEHRIAKCLAANPPSKNATEAQPSIVSYFTITQNSVDITCRPENSVAQDICERLSCYMITSFSGFYHNFGKEAYHIVGEAFDGGGCSTADDELASDRHRGAHLPAPRHCIEHLCFHYVISHPLYSIIITLAILM